jgi:hypothetical protein
MTYGLPHWARLRGMPADKVDFDIWGADVAPSWHRRLRSWLSTHSVAYQLIVHGPLLGRLVGTANLTSARSSNDVAVITVPDKLILEAFRPKGLLRGLDQDSPQVREGMRITFKLLAEMNDMCRQKGVRFGVVVIPTKESVFAEYLEHNSALALSPVLDQLLANERLARDRTFQFLADAGIAAVDTLPALKRAREGELYARTASDMHPGANGYRVIGEAVAAAAKQPLPARQP